MQEMTGGTKTRTKSRAVTKYQPAPTPARSPIALHFGRIASACGRAADQVPAPVRKITYGSARICAQSIAALVLIAVVAFAGLYAALSSGPISMSFLVRPIERAVNASMSGFRFDIGDAVLRKSDNGYGIEFRLADVSVVGEDGDRIVDAPLASADVSLTALTRGRLAPQQVDLIGPRLFLHYSEEKGLTLSSGDPRGAKGHSGGSAQAAPRSGDAPRASPPAPADPASRPTADLPIGEQQTTAPLNLTKALQDMFSAMRRG